MAMDEKGDHKAEGLNASGDLLDLPRAVLSRISWVKDERAQRHIGDD
jgi:hypothetical protein